MLKDKIQSVIIILIGIILVFFLLFMALSQNLKKTYVTSSELSITSTNILVDTQGILDKDCIQICKSLPTSRASCILGSKVIKVKKGDLVLKQELIPCEYKFMNPLSEDMAGMSRDGVKFIYQCICSDLNPIY